MTDISAADLALLNLVQGDFPLHARPFAAIATRLGRDENDVIARLQALESAGAISRFGAVFDHRSAGSSTLAALAVPPELIDDVASVVNTFAGVNHNYAREHRFNLWFVVTGPDQAAVDATLQAIRDKFDYPLLNLPMELAYNIDLGFRL